MSISGGSGTAGSTFKIPVTLSLNSGVSIDSLSLGVRITPNGSAPALTGTLGFTQDASLPPPTFVDTGFAANVISISWLSPFNPALSGTKALGFVTMTIPAGALGGQTYTLLVTGASGTKGNASANLSPGPSSTLTVSGPTIALSPSSLQFTAQQGGASPAGQTVTILNSGTGTLGWAAAVTSGSWLSLTPASGSGAGTLTVSVNISGLGANTYTGAIQVAAAGASNTPQTINVALTVTAAPAIALSPSSLTFAVQQGGSNPTNQTVTILNFGGGILSWTASVTSGPWLSVSPASGTGTATLTIAVNISGLSANTYTGGIQVAAAGASNTPQTVAVTLTIVPATAAVIVLMPDSLQFVGTSGMNPSATQSFQVLNNGSGALGWTAAVSTQSGGAWLAVSPTTGVAPSTLTVSAASASLPRGAYLGSISITALASANAGNSPQSLPVSLAVDAPVIGQNGIVNGASFSREAVVSPSSIASLFGTNLAASTQAAAVVPLPTTLAETRVLVLGKAAPLFYVSPAQINFQMPAEAAGSNVPVAVVSSGISSLTAQVKMATQVPGIFTISADGIGQGAVLNQDSLLNSTQNAAAAGSVIQIFATGLGITNPLAATGQPGATSPPLNITVDTPIVRIGGVSADVLFSGLAPGFVGLYQVNARVPAETPPGAAVSLQIQIGGKASNSATIAVR